jgi:hypothetical protein
MVALPLSKTASADRAELVGIPRYQTSTITNTNPGGYYVRSLSTITLSHHKAEAIMTMPKPYVIITQLSGVLRDTALTAEQRKFRVMALVEAAIIALDHYKGSDVDIVGTITRKHIGAAQQAVGLQ